MHPQNEGQAQPTPIPNFPEALNNHLFAELPRKADNLNTGNIEGSATHRQPFPIESFPIAIQDIIKATNKALGFPVDFTGVSILYAVCVAIGNTCRVQIKSGWIESVVLYLVLVGPPGSNKTHPSTFALKPLRKRDEKTFRAYVKAKEQYDKDIAMTKKDKAKNGAGEPIKPVFQKMIVSDVTPEALAGVMSCNKRGIGLHRDEIAGWFGNFDKYNKGSEDEFWLSTWSGDPINIDRKTSDPINIPYPFIPVIGTIQNAILNDFAKDGRNKNGFLDRILFAMPQSFEKLYWSNTELDPCYAERWESIIASVLGIKLHMDENMNPSPCIYKLSDEARSIFIDWFNTNKDISDKAPDNEKGIFSKLQNYLGRLSLILEILWGASGESNNTECLISGQSMYGATLLIEYFRGTALNVQSVISGNRVFDGLAEDKKQLLAKLPKEFTTGQGLDIAEEMGITEITYKRFLTESSIFLKTKHGKYEKLI